MAASIFSQHTSGLPDVLRTILVPAIVTLFTFWSPLLWAESKNKIGLTEIDLVEKNTDVFYLRAKVGDALSREFLFDTGSGYLALNDTTISELKTQNAAQYVRSINARMASGKIRSVKVYRISRLDLGGGCILNDIEAAKLPGDTRNIIGMNVLKRVKSFSVSYNPSRLTLTGCDANSRAVASL